MKNQVGLTRRDSCLIDGNYTPLLVIPFGSDTGYFRVSIPRRWNVINGSIDFQ